jgi:plasmid stabilization system protein ParE
VKAPIFRAAAAADLEEAFQWYQTQRVGLGEEFLVAVKSVLDDAVRHPEKYPVVHRETRRALIPRFPYGLFYRILDEQIVVVACMHGRRNPRRWQTRQ